MDTKKIETLLEGVEKKADIMALINAENGKDIQKYKERAETAETGINTVKSELETHKETIKQLETSQGDGEKVKSELEALKAKIAEDEKAQLEQAAYAEHQKRFDTVAEGKAFKHDFVRQGVLSEFEKALQDKANAGKSDADIFTALTTDKDYFASDNPIGFTSMNGNVPPATGDDAKIRAVMGLPEQK